MNINAEIARLELGLNEILQLIDSDNPSSMGKAAMHEHACNIRSLREAVFTHIVQTLPNEASDPIADNYLQQWDEDGRMKADIDNLIYRYKPSWINQVLPLRTNDIAAITALYDTTLTYAKAFQDAINAIQPLTQALTALEKRSEATGYASIIATRVILTIEIRGTDYFHFQSDDANEAKLIAFFEACTATLDQYGVTQDALAIISDRFCLKFRKTTPGLVA